MKETNIQAQVTSTIAGDDGEAMAKNEENAKEMAPQKPNDGLDKPADAGWYVVCDGNGGATWMLGSKTLLAYFLGRVWASDFPNVKRGGFNGGSSRRFPPEPAARGGGPAGIS